ncbi:MAG: hypothetical protein ACKOCH_15465, partial [Bacteroidota bacterium]
GKQLVIYISMGFGNPYGDPWNVEIVQKWVNELIPLGIGIFSLSDTIGCSNPHNISYLFSNLIPACPEVEFGAHLHTHPATWKEKVEAAWNKWHQILGFLRILFDIPKLWMTTSHASFGQMLIPRERLALPG